MVKDEVKEIMKKISNKAKAYGARNPLDTISDIESLCAKARVMYGKQQNYIDSLKSDNRLDFLKDEEYEPGVLTYLNGRLNNEELYIMYKVGKHLVEGKHPLTHDTDIVSTSDLTYIMGIIYPNMPFFSDPLVKVSSLNRRMGQILARLNSPIRKKKGSFYIPVEHRTSPKSTNQSENLWVLRNYNKYKNMGPSEFHKEYTRQKESAQAVYRDQRLRQKEQQKLVSNVSFL